MLNVFDHQRFLVCRNDGIRTKRSFREIITATDENGRPLDPDEPLALDYPHVFFNIGALGLLTYLVQVIFEPKDEEELVHRLEHPITPSEFDAAVTPLRDRFTIDGPGTSRFMQGPPPGADKNGKPPKPDDVSTILLTIRKDNSLNKMEWLNRPDTTWGVALDQIPLLLFTRNTFYEGAGGAGYQKGTAGEVAIRTLLLERESEKLIRLRRSIWLNVLHRQFQQDTFAADFAVNRPGYDGFMWEQLPKEDVPAGDISLRAGLGWMVAHHYLDITTIPEDAIATCMVTGQLLTGQAATGVWKSATGIAYGTKGDEESGTRASRLFRHPNVPTYAIRDKKTGNYGEERQQTVHRTRGLVDTLGAIFFGSERKGSMVLARVAPVLEQLYEADGVLRTYMRRHPLALTVFGFHMVGSMGGKHSGFEYDAFTYPVIAGETPVETRSILQITKELVDEASTQAKQVADLLQQALQETAAVAVEWTADENGHLSIKRKEKKTAADFAFGRDTLAMYWLEVGGLMRAFLTGIAEHASDPAILASIRTELLHSWGEDLGRLSKRLYRPHFEHYSTQAKTMPFAHHASRRFYGVLKKVTRAYAEPTES